jgi:glycosyltransferase involved in cell wall biosynthesis
MDVLRAPRNTGELVTVPEVSVILPTFNRRRYLELAIESVFAQTCTDWEMVIADDGSSGATADYLRSITTSRVRTIWLQHSGNPSRVRNAAIGAARGRYLAFLDSDDTWAPAKLEKQLSALRDSAGARWSYTLEDLIDPEGRPVDNTGLPVSAARDGWIFEPLLRLEVAISMPTIVAERRLIEELGGFDEQLRFAEWHDLCLRLAAKSAVVVVREPLCCVRIHNEHYTADKFGEQAGWMQLYEKMANLVPSRPLRTYCAQVCAETSLKLARLQGNRGNYRGALSVLRAALVFSWRYPPWWWGAMKQVLRPAVPAVLISRVRRHGRLDP